MDFVNAFKEKQISINGLKINYKIFGEGNIPLVLLPGWGLSFDKYIETTKQLIIHDSRFMILVLDLPGFGKSDVPPIAWDVNDYMELARKFIDVSLRGAERRSNPEFIAPSTGLPRFSPAGESLAMTENKIILIGHSFGGRIAIKFAAKYPEKLKALILTGAAGIKHSLTVKQKMFFWAAKIGKIIFSLPLPNKLEKLARKILYKAAREKDYYEAQGIMKETFKKVIAEDLTDCLEKIKNPTLLVWGAKDKSTPLADLKIIESRIKSHESKIIEEANHSLPYQYPEKFAEISMEFIKKL